jgi:hypothetical protein
MHMSGLKRGRILRDANSGDGLVFIEGTQYPFHLEGMWRSEFAPKVNMPVEAEFNDGGTLVALQAISGQGLAGEQAAQVIGAAQDAAKKLSSEFRAKGVPILTQYAQVIGYPILTAWALVVISWFWLPAISMNMGFMGNNSITFYQGLALLNSGGLAGLGGGAGFYGFLCFLALLAVYLPHIWRDARARFDMVAPLALMVLVVAIGYYNVTSQFSAGQQAAGAFGGPEFQKMANEMAAQAAAEMRKAISIGFGTYIALAASMFLAWKGMFKRA